MKWPMRDLGDFAVLRGGSVNPAKHPDETFELLSIPAFDEGRPDVCKGKAIGSSKKCVEPKDILLSKIVPHIRRCWIVPKLSSHRQIASGEWIQFRSDKLSPHYMRNFLVSDPFHQKFMQTISGVGGSLLRARPSEVYKIQIPLPPLAEQKRIAAILDAADALRAKRRQTIAELDALIQSTFLDLFGDPVTNPMGWVLVPFHKIGKFVSGATPSKKRDDYWDGDIPWVSPKDMKRDFIGESIDTISSKALEETNIKHIEPNRILIVVRGMILAHSFPVAINTCMVTINQDMKAIRPADSFLPLYLLGCLKAQKRQILSMISEAGHGTKKFDQKSMEETSVPAPPLPLQQRFATIVETIEAQKTRQRAHLAELDALFASLQHRAFNGEL